MKQLALLLAIFSFELIVDVRAQEPSPLQFVSEYVRELGAIERMRVAAENDFKDKNNNALSGCVQNNASMQLELRSRIRMFGNMHLQAPFDGLINTVMDLYEQRAGIHKKFVDVCTALVAGPKEGVDYGVLAAETRKITASLDLVDRGLFEATPLVFATLVDQRSDLQNRPSRLVITRSEREWLVRSLTNGFGEKLDQKHQNYIVSAASVLKESLLKDYKCSDEP